MSGVPKALRIPRYRDLRCALVFRIKHQGRIRPVVGADNRSTCLVPSPQGKGSAYISIFIGNDDILSFDPPRQ